MEGDYQRSQGRLAFRLIRNGSTEEWSPEIEVVVWKLFFYNHERLHSDLGRVSSPAFQPVSLCRTGPSPVPAT